MTSTRRGFLRGSAGLCALGAGGCMTNLFKGEKIRLAAVGVMGKGYSDWVPMLKSGLVKIVAFCDCDYNLRAAAQNRLIQDGIDFDMMQVPFYTDYRRLLDDAGVLGIQAMTVSTTDHTHAAIAIRAMKLGIHVYVQKPLVRTLWELDYFNRTAKEYGVITQMGNQGSALNGFRRGVEVLRSGILGEVKEVHVWTNRPVWPQGLVAKKCTEGKADVIPSGFNWSTWLGPAADRAFKGKYAADVPTFNPWNPKRRFSPNVYHQFNWRGFYDFGCGAFGDMACHTMNLPFRGLELGHIRSAECTMIEEKNDVAFPMKSVVKLVYAARESKFREGVTLPETTLYWYDGNEKPSADLMPQVIAAGLNKDESGKSRVPNTGCLIIGSKGILCSTNDYGGKSYIALTGEKAVEDVERHEAAQQVARTIPYRADAADGVTKGPGAASVSANGHYIEFLDAIRGEGPVFEETDSRCFSDVDFSIPIMEGILCGCVAQRVPGQLGWCSRTQMFDNAAANELVKPYIRKGFEF